MARLSGGGSRSPKNSKTSKFRTNSHKLRHALEMESLDEGEEDEEEYFLSSSKTHKKKNKKRKKHRRRHVDDDDEDEEEEFHDEDADAPTASSLSSSCNCTHYQKKVFLCVLVLVVVGVVSLTQLDRIVVAFGQVKDGVGTMLNEYTTSSTDNNPAAEHGAMESVVQKEFHGQASSSFGGLQNVAQPGGAKAAAHGYGRAYDLDLKIPVSNVGHAIPSMNRPNYLNLWGHYVHDEHRSPYASHLYDASHTVLEARQANYTAKLEKIRETWGAWHFQDPLKMTMDDGATTSSSLHDGATYRPVADFSTTDYKDLPVDDFPIDAWQADYEYTAAFLPEAQALVRRMKEGIYTEYGHPTPIPLDVTSDAYHTQQALWQIQIYNPDLDTCTQPTKNVYTVNCGPPQKDNGLATFHVTAWQGFVKKLLHAMLTNDDFYVVLGGHSAAAGHGNDFQQNRILHGFHYIMEPVMDKLGIRLLSRNMGMGGVGTLQFTLGGGDMYGEADIIEWDSGMTEGGPAVDLFYKQAILSGERVPLLLIPGGKGHPFNLFEETAGKVMLGELLGGNDKAIMAPDTTFENFASKPYASRWMNQKSEKYNAICWEPRSDFTPITKQSDKPGSQVGWHPGNRAHTWSGRKVALIVLEGLQHALQIWENELNRTRRTTQTRTTTSDDTGTNRNTATHDNGVSDDTEQEAEGETEGCCPLAAKHWHVGDMYKEIRQNLRTYVSTPKESGEDIRSDCEKLISYLPRICRVQMHAFGMWSPRAHLEYDFLNIIHEAPNGYKPSFLLHNVYDGFDLLPLVQQLGDDDVDVHAIAIATSNPPPDIDHSWIVEDDVSNNSTTNTSTTGEAAASAAEKPASRRELHRASNHAFHQGSELDATSPTKHNSNKNENKKHSIHTNRSPRQQQTLVRTSNKKNRQLESSNGEESNEGKQSLPKRTYVEGDIVPGRGWILHGWTPVKGFCDGSPQSECGRIATNNCLLAGHNDKHWDVMGSPLSGWLVFTVPNVREGIILLRIEWWCGGSPNRGTELTKDWTEVNDGHTFDTVPMNATRDLVFQQRRLSHEDAFHTNKDDTTERKLKGKMDPVPDDWQFDIVINNGEMRTMNRTEFISHQKEYVKNVAVWPILNDESMSANYEDDDGKLNPVEVAVRFRSEINPRHSLCISHVYYA